MKLNQIALAKAIETLRAIKHPLRQQMMDYIEEQKSINVNSLITKFELPQSVVSQQLSILRNAGVVKTKREGKQIFYSINTHKVEHIKEIISQF